MLRAPSPASHVGSRCSRLDGKAAVGLAKGTLVDLGRWVDVGVDSQVLLGIAGARMHEVTTPDHDVADFDPRQEGGLLVAAAARTTRRSPQCRIL